MKAPTKEELSHPDLDYVLDLESEIGELKNRIFILEEALERVKTILDTI